VKLNIDVIREVWRLYHAGVMQKDIAVKLGVHKNTVYKVLKRGEPADARAVGPPVEASSGDSGDLLSRMRSTLVGLFNAEGDSDRKRRLAETIAELDSEILRRTPVVPQTVNYVVTFGHSCLTKNVCRKCGFQCPKPMGEPETGPDKPSSVTAEPEEPLGVSDEAKDTEPSTTDEAKLDSMIQTVEAQRKPKRERESDLPAAAI